MKLRNLDPSTFSVDSTLEFDIVNSKSKVLVQAGTLINSELIDSLMAMEGDIFCIVHEDESAQEIRGSSLFTGGELEKALNTVEQTCQTIRESKDITQDHIDSFKNVVQELYESMQVRRQGRLSLVKADTKGWKWYHAHLLNTSLIVMNYTFLSKNGEAEVKAMALGALLHDIGYLFHTPEELFSDKVLSRDQKEVFVLHTSVGYEKLKNLRMPDQVRQAILFHHETFSEDGYPTGLPADRIPAAAKYTAIAETIENISQDRPYRKGKPLTEALREMLFLADKQFERPLLHNFLRLMGPQLIGTKTLLTRNIVIKTNYNEIGRVLHPNSNSIAPEIELLLDSKNRLIQKPLAVNLSKDPDRFIRAAYSEENSRKLLKTVYSKLNTLEDFNRDEQKMNQEFKPL